MLANRLILNSFKPNLIIFNSKQYSTTNPINVCCLAGINESQSQAKYLKLVVDNKFNFAEHTKAIAL